MDNVEHELLKDVPEQHMLLCSVTGVEGVMEWKIKYSNYIYIYVINEIYLRNKMVLSSLKESHYTIYQYISSLGKQWNIKF